MKQKEHVRSRRTRKGVKTFVVNRGNNKCFQKKQKRKIDVSLLGKIESLQKQKNSLSDEIRAEREAAEAMIELLGPGEASEILKQDVKGLDSAEAKLEVLEELLKDGRRGAIDK